MSNVKLFYLFFSAAVILVLALSYQGCSQLDEEAVLAPNIGVHPEGWADTLNKTNPNFHAQYINTNKKWNLAECRQCHGDDYSGGSTGASCRTCHTSSSGPQSCRLCHGGVSGHANPPKALNGDTSTTSLGVGAHMRHLYTNRYSAQVECEECHIDFNGFRDPLHIDANPDGIAEITFGPLAKDTNGGIIPNPQWNRSIATCSDAYCHGKFEQGNQSAVGIWTQSNSVVCGSCHGDPNTLNPTPRLANGQFVPPHFSFMNQTSCYVCHTSVINAQGEIIGDSLHVNGEVNF